MDLVKTFVCVPRATQVVTLCNLLEDDVVKVIDSTTSSRWWSKCHPEKSIAGDAPDQPVTRSKGRRMSLVEKISDVYVTEFEGFGKESKRANQVSGSGPRQVMEQSQFLHLLQKDMLSQDVEPQSLMKQQQISKMKNVTEKPVVAVPTQQNRDNTDPRGFKQRCVACGPFSQSGPCPTSKIVENLDGII
jgi:hypothetical protein